MKRSRQVALLSMGVGALLLTACDKTPKEVAGAVFSSIDECQSAGVFTEAQCTAAFEQAVDLHETDARQFADITECEAEFGENQCQRAPSDKGEARYRPSFSGFFIGAMLGQALSRPVYPPAAGQQGFRTANGSAIGVRSGAVTVPTTTIARPAGGGAAAISRAGFGATSSTVGATQAGAKGGSGG